MLAKLVGGFAINPDLVKYIYIRKDRVQMEFGPRIMHIVALKLDDAGDVPVSYCDTMDEAIKISEECTDRINKALGVEEPSSDDSSDDYSSSDDSSSDDSSSDDSSSDDDSSSEESSDE